MGPEVFHYAKILKKLLVIKWDSPMRECLYQKYLCHIRECLKVKKCPIKMCINMSYLGMCNLIGKSIKGMFKF